MHFPFLKYETLHRSIGNIFVSITISLFILLSGIDSCSAAESEVISSENFHITGFSLEEIDDLRHPVCTFSLKNNHAEDVYYYVEGAICPAGPGDCISAAIIKLNGKITKIKQISSDATTSIFNNGTLSIVATYIPVETSTMDEEGNVVDSIIIIKTKNSEKHFKMSGYCGV
ncbi:adhesin [Klebsiella sp. MISC125]|uniref:adhesin n=1 Tax=Klebsiella sp. MISC125 TaxID=2755386 RepID=UPI003DA9D0A3